MAVSKIQVTATLKEKEYELLRQATDDKKDSVKTLLMRGVYEKLGLDVEMSS